MGTAAREPADLNCVGVSVLIQAYRIVFSPRDNHRLNATSYRSHGSMPRDQTGAASAKNLRLEDVCNAYVRAPPGGQANMHCSPY